MASSSFAFCSDCDFMSWNGYLNIHSRLDQLGLPAGDSFWLFDPSGSDMALFTHDLEHKGPKHDELLAEIVAGRIDVLHSAGSYGEKFNKGYRPDRRLIGGALEYLAKNGAAPKIWSNHGDAFNIQNIGGAVPQSYHRGDLPGSETFILDLLIEFGIDFFWLDRLLINDPQGAYRLVSREQTRAGFDIRSFSRFMGMAVSPNGQNLGRQLSEANLQAFQDRQQSTVLYQHWGCHHDAGRIAYTPPMGDELTSSSIEGLERLAQAHHDGKIKVVRLTELLKAESEKNLGDEAQRIGRHVVSPEEKKADNFYFNQYNKYSVEYFRNRLANMGVSGSVALDAGCGVGQWSFALTDLGFDEVVGIDASEQAIQYVESMTALLRQTSPKFSLGSIEALPYSSGYFDFLISYGVIFCARVDVALKEFARVLKPQSEAYICLNADGWYQYLIDVRFAAQSFGKKSIYALPLWNAFFDRVGGREHFLELEKFPSVQELLQVPESPMSIEQSRQLIHELVANQRKQWGWVVESYSDEIVQMLAEYCRAYFLKFEAETTAANEAHEPIQVSAGRLSLWNRLRNRWRGAMTGNSSALAEPVSPKLPDMSAYSPYVQLHGSTQGRVYQPGEFQDLAYRTGFDGFVWASDARVRQEEGAVSVTPIYEADYQGHPAVWECILTRNGEQPV